MQAPARLPGLFYCCDTHFALNICFTLTSKILAACTAIDPLV
jgi:hypothetical protein